MGERLLGILKAVVAAAVAAAIAVLADVDWTAIIGAAVASGGLTWATPNDLAARRKQRG